MKDLLHVSKLIGYRIFLTALGIMLALAYIPQQITTFYLPYPFRIEIPKIVWVMGNFDGAHYIEIAQMGYRPLEQGFFPLYPMLIAILHTITTLPYLYSALAISGVSLVVALIYMKRLFILDGYGQMSDILLLVVLFFPSSFYLTAVYNDALFLALSVATLYLGRTGRYRWGSLCAAAATLARLNGLALFFFLVSEYIHAVRNRSKITYASFGLIPAAFAGYLIYIQSKFGSYQSLLGSMKVWHQDKPTLPPQVLYRYLKILIHYTPQEYTYWVAVLEIAFVILYTLIVVYSYRKIRLSYWLFMTVSLLIPMFTGTFQGMPRYGLHVYPMFLAIVIYLQSRRPLWTIVYLVVSTILYALLLGLFISGYFVA